MLKPPPGGSGAAALHAAAAGQLQQQGGGLPGRIPAYTGAPAKHGGRGSSRSRAALAAPPPAPQPQPAAAAAPLSVERDWDWDQSSQEAAAAGRRKGKAAAKGGKVAAAKQQGGGRREKSRRDRCEGPGASLACLWPRDGRPAAGSRRAGTRARLACPLLLQLLLVEAPGSKPCRGARRYLDVEAFWRSASKERRRELLRVPLSSLLEGGRTAPPPPPRGRAGWPAAWPAAGPAAGPAHLAGAARAQRGAPPLGQAPRTATCPPPNCSRPQLLPSGGGLR
jgi:hypothetical protein